MSPRRPSAPRPSSLAALLALCALLVALAGAWAGPAAAQSLGGVAGSSAPEAAPPDAPAIDSLPDDLTRAEFEALLSRMSDREARALLVEWFQTVQGDSAAAANGELDDFEDRARAFGAEFGARRAELMTHAPTLSELPAFLAEKIDGVGGLGTLLAALAISFGAGFGARYLWRRRAVERQSAIAERNAHLGPWANLRVCVDAILFLIIELSGIVVFFFVAMTALHIAFRAEDLRLIVSAYIWATTGVMAVMAVLGLCMPREWAVYRLVPLSDAGTARLYVATFAVAVIWQFGFSSIDVIWKLGFDEQAGRLLIIGNVALFTLSLVAAILLFHRDLEADRADAAPTATGARGFVDAIGDNWHVLAAAYAAILGVLSAGAVVMADGGDLEAVGKIATTSMAILLGFPIFYGVFSKYIGAQMTVDARVADAFRRAMRLILLVLAVQIFAEIWGIDAALTDSGDIDAWLFAAATDVVIIALIGYLIWDLVRTWIDVRLAQEEPEAHDDEAAHEGEGGVGVSRAATLLPLFRTFAMTVILVAAVFSVAASLGVNITPLLAGAGVVGIAIGFGAQTLVRDIVSGVFFLVDDAFRRGEYIEIGAIKGTVEQISLRSFQLRHHRGAVHTIPFGEIQSLTNYSRDWVIMKLPLRLTYDTDPGAVKRIIKQIGVDMAADPLLGSKLLEPPKSQGVIQMEDSAMILRVKFKAVPGEQFVLRRELLHRIRAAFETAGVRFASREVMVRVSGDAQNPAVAEAAGAAARRTIDAEAEMPTS